MSDSKQPFCILFPGQGSQSVGMMNLMAEQYPLVNTVFQEASEVLDFDLWSLVKDGPADQLNQTEYTQPAMLASGVAVWRIWTEQGGPMPQLMAGHSLGEYSALVCAGAMKFADAVKLVSQRGHFMQEAVPAGEGAMAAIIGMADEQVEQACAKAAQGEVVSAVNYNSPGQVVIAGAKSAVERACEEAKAAGAKRALVLPVSVPSHCALMEPAAKRLGERLADIQVKAPSVPVLQNVNAEATDDPALIKQQLTVQLHKPVLWVKTINNISSSGIKLAIEAGPGKVLCGLSKRIDKSMDCIPVYDPAGLDKAFEVIHA